MDKQTIDIPITIYGREVKTEDTETVIYAGRIVQFRFSDLRPLLDELALPYPLELRKDFTNVKVGEMIYFPVDAVELISLGGKWLFMAAFGIPDKMIRTSRHSPGPSGDE